MAYLTEFGFVSDEKKERGFLDSLLIELNDISVPHWEYNKDLDIGNFIHFLKIFGTDKRNYDEWANEHSYDYQRGRTYEHQIERVLYRSFVPLQDRSKILKRQELIRRFIQEGEKSQEKGLVGLTQGILTLHNGLRSACSGGGYSRSGDSISMDKAGRFFSALVRRFKLFYNRYKDDELLGNFAQEVGNLLENPFTEMTRFFENGINLVTSNENFYLVSNKPKGKGVFYLGSFKKSRDATLGAYPGKAEDVAEVKKFSFSSAALVYTLGSFFYQAEIYRRRKRLGLPVCLPNINEDGRFKIENAYPITTHLRSKGDLFSFEYDKNRRRFLFGGAHSGGKSELIKNVGGYHIVGLGGGIVFCDEGAEIPMTRRVITSFRREQESGKGALESEVKQALRLDRDAMERDLLLIDEFLDTTKPELAMHIASPILKGEEGLCRGLANSPGTVLIVDHRASRMSEDYGFEFMAPVLLRIKGRDLEKRLEKRGYYGKIPEEEKDQVFLVPTHDFVAGKPNKDEVREHALELWEKSKAKIDYEKRTYGEIYMDGARETYGIGEEENQEVRTREEMELPEKVEKKDNWEKYEEPEPVPEPEPVREPESVSKQINFWHDERDDGEDLPF